MLTSLQTVYQLHMFWCSLVQRAETILDETVKNSASSLKRSGPQYLRRTASLDFVEENDGVEAEMLVGSIPRPQFLLLSSPHPTSNDQISRLHLVLVHDLLEEDQTVELPGHILGPGLDGVIERQRQVDHERAADILLHVFLDVVQPTLP